jgi:hypothetical protein
MIHSFPCLLSEVLGKKPEHHQLLGGVLAAEAVSHGLSAFMTSSEKWMMVTLMSML